MRYYILAAGLPSILLAYLSALFGRGYGEFGIASIIGMYSFNAQDFAASLNEILLNVFQGIFIVSDGIISPAEYSTAYKIYSFSPLPSILDGFDVRREFLEYRLHDYIPMPAIAELYHFGWPYLVPVATAYVLLLRLIISVYVAKLPIMPILLSGAVGFLILQAGAYPVRNVFRQTLLLYLVVVVLNLMLRAASRRPSQEEGSTTVPK